MSAYYKEKNNESTRDLFNKKMVYKSNMLDYANNYPNITNFNYGEKLLYGRVNRLFVPIQIRDPDISLKGFKSVSQPAQGIKFVVDAFEDMARQFRKCAMAGKINTSDPYLSNLLVYKAYQSPEILYQGYKNIYFGTIAANFKGDKLNVKNFDEFIEKLNPMLEKPSHSIPFTKTAFVKSRRCPINVSGLVVEIADLDPVNDDEKINAFVNSPNWEFYVNTCKSYGFMIDQEMPWRLVADIGSSAMIEYAARYALGGTDLIIHSIYGPSHLSYFNNLMPYLLSLYNICKEETIIEIEECGDRSITSLVTPSSYSLAQIAQQYREIYFFKLYMKIRFWEDESKEDDAPRAQLERDCVQIYLTRGLDKALYVFERIINKPFDYRGSLSYIYKQVDAMRESEIE